MPGHDTIASARTHHQVAVDDGVPSVLEQSFSSPENAEVPLAVAACRAVSVERDVLTVVEYRGRVGNDTATSRRPITISNGRPVWCSDVPFVALG